MSSAELLSLHRQYINALNTKDLQFFETIFEDDVVVRRFDGTVVHGKTEALIILHKSVSMIGGKIVSIEEPQMMRSGETRIRFQTKFLLKFNIGSKAKWHGTKIKSIENIKNCPNNFYFDDTEIQSVDYEERVDEEEEIAIGEDQSELMNQQGIDEEIEPSCFSIQHITKHLLFVELLNYNNVHDIGLLLSYYVRLVGSDGNGIQGKEKVMKALEKFLSNIAGLVQCTSDVQTMHSGQTRHIFHVKKGLMSSTMGTKIDWMSGQILKLAIIKNVTNAFYLDDTQLENETKSEINSIKLRLLDKEISSPYLIPQPESFSRPRITISNFTVQALLSKSRTATINPVAVFRIISRTSIEQEYRTQIKFNQNDASWDEVITFDIPDPDRFLQIKIMNRKQQLNKILAEILIPLSNFQVSMDEPILLQYQIRLHQKPSHHCQVSFMFQYENSEMWWVLSELNERDNQKEANGIIGEFDPRNKSGGGCLIM